MTETEQRKRVVEEARTWLNTPYHHHADVKGAGVDCAMILVRIYCDLGILPPFDPRPYPRDWHMHRDAERYLGWLEQMASEVEHPQEGDIAVWRFGRCFSHGAVFVGDNRVIHSFMGQGVILSDMGEHELAKRPVRFFSPW